MAVDQNGNFIIKNLDVDDDLVSMNSLTEGINEDVILEDFLIEESIDEELDVQEDAVLPPIVYEMIEAESFVGLRTTTPKKKSLELFFVLKVVDKNWKKGFIQDKFGHDIGPDK